MGELKIYGASDDLIEVEGDFSEEIGCYIQDDTKYISISDGTLLEVRYDSFGRWKFCLISKSKFGTKVNIKIFANDDEDNYSDVVTLSNNKHIFSWVAMSPIHDVIFSPKHFIRSD